MLFVLAIVGVECVYVLRQQSANALSSIFVLDNTLHNANSLFLRNGLCYHSLSSVVPQTPIRYQCLR